MGEEDFDIMYEDETDSELLRSEAEPLRVTSSLEKRRLVEDKLEQRRLEKQIRGYDYDLD